MIRRRLRKARRAEQLPLAAKLHRREFRAVTLQ
jgi:hypothetical protein